MGAVTLAGNGYAKVTLGATASATVTATGASTQGNVSAASMTSSLSNAVIDASASVASFAITGGAGNDTITVGNAANTVTPGQGADSITLEASGASATSLSTIVLNVGDSNRVVDGAANDDTGQDSIYHIDAAGADTIVVSGVSTDTYWNIADHVLMGSGNAGAAESSDAGNAAAYNDVAALIQFGDNSSATDAFDIVFNAYTDGTTAVGNDALLQAQIAVDITGTIGNDTITTGANADTISGGAGDDLITGGALGDVQDGGAGNDVYNIDDASHSAGSSSSQTTLAGIDIITIGTGDTIDLAGISGTKIVDATNDDVISVTLGTAGGAENDFADFVAAIEAAITGTVQEVSIVKVSDLSTDSSFDGDYDGYYLVVNDATAAINASDTFIKLLGVTDATEISVASQVVSFG
jgi:hypothetical protein